MVSIPDPRSGSRHLTAVLAVRQAHPSHASPPPPAPVALGGATIDSQAAGRYWPCGPPGHIYWPCGPPGQYEPGPAAGHPRINYDSFTWNLAHLMDTAGLWAAA
jgi:hypothetical protein